MTFADWRLALGVLLCFQVVGPRCAGAADAPAAENRAVLANERLGVSFDHQSGCIVSLENKASGETYALTGDDFDIDVTPAPLRRREAQLASFDIDGDRVTAVYRQGEQTITVTYRLRGHFVEKQISFTPAAASELKHVVLGRPAVLSPAVRFVEYRYPKFERKPGEEPSCTFFGRTAKGGIFAGVEMPYDRSVLGQESLELVYTASLRLKAGETYLTEPAYFGVYARAADDAEQPGLPLHSETDAMLRMTTVVLGPRRHGLVPMNCGWHSEMQQHAFKSAEDVEGDMKSLDFLVDCGIDWSSESHPWGGEAQKLNSLVDDQKYTLDDSNQRLLKHAKQIGVKIVQWPTLNNSDPWGPEGKPFRSDRLDWRMSIDRERYKSVPDIRGRGNCLGVAPFEEWLTRIVFDALDTGYYSAMGVDGDFFGGGGWFTTSIPVTCTADNHDHLPGDSNYACQRALDKHIAAIRTRYPQMHIEAGRPPMDLGVWALRNYDVCFTLVEHGTPVSHLAGGDQIRQYSRVRVQRDFCPHYRDQSLLFPSRMGGPTAPRNWTSEHLDYILLSALSCSPELLFYLPTKSGMPDADKATIRRWLDWGRENVRYLDVRRDLPDWPGPGRVDGSAHIVDDRGLVFLFNGGEQAIESQFSLSAEAIGLARGKRFRVRQQFPAADSELVDNLGSVVHWTVPGRTAIVLEIAPVE